MSRFRGILQQELLSSPWCVALKANISLTVICRRMLFFSQTPVWGDIYTCMRVCVRMTTFGQRASRHVRRTSKYQWPRNGQAKTGNTKSWRKADAFGEFRGGPGTKSWRFRLPISAYPFHFSLPISGPLKVHELGTRQRRPGRDKLWACELSKLLGALKPGVLYYTSTMFPFGPQGSFFLCAVCCTKSCSYCPNKCLTQSKVLQILFAGDLWPTQVLVRSITGLFFWRGNRVGGSLCRVRSISPVLLFWLVIGQARYARQWKGKHKCWKQSLDRVCIYIYIYIYVCMYYVYIYIYIYTRIHV